MRFWKCEFCQKWEFVTVFRKESMNQKGATRPNLASLRPIVNLSLATMALKSQHVAIKAPPAGLCPAMAAPVGLGKMYKRSQSSCKVCQKARSLCSSGLCISRRSRPAQKMFLLVEVSTIPLFALSVSTWKMWMRKWDFQKVNFVKKGSFQNVNLAKYGKNVIFKMWILP